MAQSERMTFTFKEITELMVRKAGVKEGLWAISLKLGIQGVSIGQTPDELVPAAIVPILEIGIERVDTPSRLSVDAAEVSAPLRARVKKAKARAETALK